MIRFSREPKINQKSRQQGVTLIELMVALAIGLIATAAMLKVYIDASRIYRFNDGLARLQENGRFALEFIRRDVRAAGFWGCNSDSALSNVINPASNSWINIAAGHIEGLNGTARSGQPDTSDSITLRGAFSSGVSVTSPMTSTSSDITVDSVLGFSKDSPAVISDCENADFFSISNTPSNEASALSHSASGNNVSNELSKAYQTDARVYQARQITYCIAPGANDAIPALRRLTNPSASQTCSANGDELIEGIENLQFLYGEDTDADADGNGGDGNANRYLAAGTAGLDIDRVVSLRLSMLVRSIENNLSSTSTSYTFNGATITPDDRYLRKVFTTTITLRNKAK